MPLDPTRYALALRRYNRTHEMLFLGGENSTKNPLYPVKVSDSNNLKHGLDWLWVLVFHLPLWPLQREVTHCGRVHNGGWETNTNTLLFIQNNAP